MYRNVIQITTIVKVFTIFGFGCFMVFSGFGLLQFQKQYFDNEIINYVYIKIEFIFYGFFLVQAFNYI